MTDTDKTEANTPITTAWPRTDFAWLSKPSPLSSGANGASTARPRIRLVRDASSSNPYVSEKVLGLASWADSVPYTPMPGTGLRGKQIRQDRYKRERGVVMDHVPFGRYRGRQTL